MREMFRLLLAQLAAHAASYDVLLARQQAAQTALSAWVRKENARRARRHEDPLGPLDAVEQIGDPALRATFAALLAELAEHRAERTRLDAALAGAARQTPPRPGRQGHVLDVVCSHEYSTQGWGADRYAQGAAEKRADVARRHWIEVDVVRACVLWDGAGAYYAALPAHARTKEGDWHVVVYVEEELDVELLRRLPGPDLVEFVRLAWKRGVNPRVYNPWIPHDFEARHGLDYFGGRVEAQHA